MIKFVKDVFVNLIKFLFCLILSLYISSISFYGASNKIDWQVILFLIFSAFVFGLIWYIAFSIIELKKKVILSLIFIVWLFSPKIIPSVKYAFDFDSCMDIGVCSEGLIMKANDGSIVEINKSNCIANGYVWYEKYKSCNLRENIK